MPDLFDEQAEQARKERAPLADRMRPRTLGEFVGREHFIGAGKLLRRAIEADRVTSVLFYDPPGTGKTTLARIIARTTEAHFTSFNAVLSGVNDLREAIQKAKNRRKHHQTRTILFIDEVHRFNTAQQDALLPHVEDGTVTFIGATTENPYFEVNDALVSRSRVFELEPLEEEDLRQVAAMALTDAERGYGDRDVEVTEAALDHLIDTANGDTRSVLNALELAVETTSRTPRESSTSTCQWPNTRSSSGPCCTTRRGTPTSTPSAPSSKACAHRSRSRAGVPVARTRQARRSSPCGPPGRATGRAYDPSFTSSTRVPPEPLAM